MSTAVQLARLQIPLVEIRGLATAESSSELNLEGIERALHEAQVELVNSIMDGQFQVIVERAMESSSICDGAGKTAVKAESYQRSRRTKKKAESNGLSPPFNAEYLLYFLLRKAERDTIVGDLVEEFAHIHRRFGGRRARVWFYKEVAFSSWPFVRRAMVRVVTFVWVGRLLRQLIS